jgi:hypothetical protein
MVKRFSNPFGKHFSQGDPVMGLQEKLDDMRKKLESNIPPEALTVMHRATEDLLQSGIMDQVLTKGDQAPEFTLPDERGNMVNTLVLLNEGPLVVSFYRGVW